MIKLNGTELGLKRFSSKEQFIDITTICDYLDYEVNNIYWRYEDDSELFVIYSLKKHIDEYFQHTKTVLTMPYIPNARMDRINMNSICTLKYFTDIINSLNFKEVVVLNPHSEASLLLIDRVCQMNGSYDIQGICNAINKIVSENTLDVLFFPDLGSSKKYENAFKYPYNFPQLFGYKKRDTLTGRVDSMQVLGEPPKENFSALIVDDICTTGDTLYQAAEKLRDMGAINIYAYISHCEPCMKFSDYLSTDLISCIYTTNSIYTGNHNKIKVIANID